MNPDDLHSIERFLVLIGLGDGMYHIKSNRKELEANNTQVHMIPTIEEAHQKLTEDPQYYTLIVFDVGKAFELAEQKLDEVHSLVGKQNSIFFGETPQSAESSQIVNNCIQKGLLYFASKPYDFRQFRTKMLDYFDENGIHQTHRKASRSAIGTSRRTKANPTA